VGIAPAEALHSSWKLLHDSKLKLGDRMTAPPNDYFDAGFPGATQVVRIASLHEAKVFARRWVIRDKDPDLKSLLKHIEKANSAATADVAIQQLKHALSRRGLLVTTAPSLDR
jgi:hypothetical protein